MRPSRLLEALNSSLGAALLMLSNAPEFTLSADLSALENLDQTLTLTARVAPDYERDVSVSLVGDCSREIPFDQALDPAEWRVKGSSRYDDRGWLEMTGRQTYTAGGTSTSAERLTPATLTCASRPHRARVTHWARARVEKSLMAMR